MATPPPPGTHPVLEPELVFAHVRARLEASTIHGDPRGGRERLPRLSRAATAKALTAGGFRTLTGLNVSPSDLNKDGTQFLDDTETVLLETLALGRRFYGLYVEPQNPSHEQWDAVTAMFAELGAKLDARLGPVEQFLA
ncbi:hypothetical protein [Frigoribacterium sp. PhB116]|uniref:hypothetical protein n=1 Tax=Frigoribacterium sp. PhB116 TaxID=2485174 RepID=UPI00105EC032|nr:hypothetical protein [Frigoribacterium sp. PhB116]TDT62635.1 hypothetical protein EDF20_2649 [Frigoribacterium sp. PhB116]